MYIASLCDYYPRLLLKVLQQFRYRLFAIAGRRLHPALYAHADQFLEGFLFFLRHRHVLVQTRTLIVKTHTADIQIVIIQTVLLQRQCVDRVGEQHHRRLFELRLLQNVDEFLHPEHGDLDVWRRQTGNGLLHRIVSDRIADDDRRLDPIVRDPRRRYLSMNQTVFNIH